MIRVWQLKGVNCKLALELKGACFVMFVFSLLSPLIIFLHAL